MARHERKDEERQRAVEMRLAGAKLEEIGQAFGVSRERARQWLVGSGLEGVTFVEARLKFEQAIQEAGISLVRYYRGRGHNRALVQCGTCSVTWDVRFASKAPTCCPDPSCENSKTKVYAGRKAETAEKYLGQRFGAWTLLARTDHSHNYLARCDCGTEKVVSINNLRRGVSQSCHPCSLKRRKAVHGF